MSIDRQMGWHRRASIMSPIKPERKKLYPPNWEKISELVIEKANYKCELCGADNGFPHPVTKSQVVLTVHHINGDPTDNRRVNLIALCQRCHLRLDQPFKIKKAKTGNLFTSSESEQ